jgi:hypothetical protein
MPGILATRNSADALRRIVMAKTNMLCPFSQKLCSECPLYRGRHYYLSLCQKYRGYIEKPEGTKPGANHNAVDFPTLWKLVQPWADGHDSETKPKTKLKLIDVDNDTSRFFELEEAKNWDWDDPTMMRVIGELQVTSWDNLVELVRFKAKKGYREVVVYEAPRFMLLGGG